MIKRELEQVQNIILDTVTLLCKNSLKFKQQLQIQGLIGITIDEEEVFLVHLNEKYQDIVREERKTCDGNSPKTAVNELAAVMCDKKLLVCPEVDDLPPSISKQLHRKRMRKRSWKSSALSNMQHRNATVTLEQSIPTFDIDLTVEDLHENSTHNLLVIPDATERTLSKHSTNYQPQVEIKLKDLSDVDSSLRDSCVQNKKSRMPSTPIDKHEKSADKLFGVKSETLDIDCESGTSDTIQLEPCVALWNTQPTVYTDNFNEYIASALEQCDGSQVGRFGCSERRPTSSQDKQFVCDYSDCYRAYYDRKNLLRHQTRDHGRIPCFRRGGLFERVT